ncbi:CDP-glycerol glycerophosphotransferase family protein [Bacillus kwashiorkori]|uniref:CDP-glycerol glycerophosphotransferase family protein n=1 Tax=Bacillus kwashiorkori TaxID=1522318 RepID=UPI000780E975|nr:CDP-glycerol glycerophosphotransferase family protein [Bacillus kwashiorkori]
MVNLITGELVNITALHTKYKLFISTDIEWLTEYKRWEIVLQERITKAQYELPSELKGNASNSVIEVTIDLDNLEQLSTEKIIYDLFIRVENNDSMEQFRIKSNPQVRLEFFQLAIPNSSMIFEPYTTNKGNLSFRVNEIQLRSYVHDLQVSIDGNIKISGFFLYPNYDDSKIEITASRLVITNQLNNEEIILPLKNFKEEILELYNGSNRFAKGSFSTELVIGNEVDYKNLIYYRFFVDVDFMVDKEQQTIRSKRMKYTSKEIEMEDVFLRHEHKKYRVIVKPTKRYKYLSVKVYEYSLFKELKGKIGRKVRSVKARMRRFSRKAYRKTFAYVSKLPKKENLIVFESFHGRQYSDNPRAIYEYMVAENKKYQMIWSVDKEFLQKFKDKNVKIAKRSSIRWLYYMARAKYWVINARLPLWLPKSSETIYLQTWHGTPLKRLGIDIEEVHMPGTNTIKYKQNFVKEASKWDYLISPNRYSSEIFRRAFHFQKEMLETGYPRNDILYSPDKRVLMEQLKEKLGLPTNKKIILYAPTWRDNHFYKKGAYRFDLELDLQQMRRELGNDYIILLRMHYLVAENLNLTPYKGFAYDFSNYDDIRDLYLLADLLITDYSSVFFDYANLKRPMIFFVYDLEEYRDSLRGFYFDFANEAPGPLVKTTIEVIQTIKKQEEEGFDRTTSEKVTKFYQKFCSLEDGNATKRVVERVFHP